MPRRTLRNQIINQLQYGSIVSLLQFLWDIGCFDYSYGLRVFRQLEREQRITMTRTNLRGRPWEVRPGPNYRTPVQIDQYLLENEGHRL